MLYHLFVQEVADGLNEIMGKEVNIRVQDVIKNNNTFKCGIVISESDVNIAPTIYMEEFFEQYLKGREKSSIIQEISQLYSNIKAQESLDLSDLVEWEKAKDKILYRLVDFDSNADFLKHHPYVRFNDLAIIFYILMNVDEKGMASIVITNEICSTWNTTVENLYKVAKENTPRKLQFEFLPMNQIIIDLFPEAEMSDMEDNRMYVLSNTHRNFGAIAILYDGVLEYIHQTIGKDFFILPSSVHEVIILPKEDDMDIQAINDMIKEINETQVAEEEVLSNHCYLFERDKGIVF